MAGCNDGGGGGGDAAAGDDGQSAAAAAAGGVNAAVGGAAAGGGGVGGKNYNKKFMIKCDELDIPMQSNNTKARLEALLEAAGKEY